MTKQVDSSSPRGRAPASTTEVRKRVTGPSDAPAPEAAIAANGAFPREGLGADTDDVDLRTRVYAHVRKYSTPSWSRARHSPRAARSIPACCR